MLDRFASGTVFEPFALTLASIMFPLILQKTLNQFKDKRSCALSREAIGLVEVWKVERST